MAIAYRLAPSYVLAGLEALWAREMLTSIYRPRWLTVAVYDRAVPAIKSLTSTRPMRSMPVLASRRAGRHHRRGARQTR